MVAKDNDISRRKWLKTGAVVGAGTLAGCFGGQSGGSGDGGGREQTNLVALSTAEGTSTFEVVAAMQRALNQESDWLSIDQQVVGGNPDALRAYDAGEADIYFQILGSHVDAYRGEGTWSEDPPQNLGAQVTPYLITNEFPMAVAGSGIENFDQARDPNVATWVLDPAWGTRQLAIEHLELAGMWEDIKQNEVLVSTGELAGAIEEGRIDVFYSHTSNAQSMGGFLQEVDERIDVHLIDMPDAWIQAAKDFDKVIYKEYEPFAYSQEITEVTDTIQAWDNPQFLNFGPHISDEAVYEFCRVVNQEWDVLQEAVPNIIDLSDVENMVDPLSPALPVHSGAIQYYNDQGVDADLESYGEDVKDKLSYDG